MQEKAISGLLSRSSGGNLKLLFGLPARGRVSPASGVIALPGEAVAVFMVDVVMVR